MSDSHGTEGRKSSPRRLLIILVIMVGVAALSFLPSLFSRGTTGIHSTATDITTVFIPVWLTLTVGVVIITFYFFRALITSERKRDSETPRPAEPVHSH